MKLKKEGIYMTKMAIKDERKNALHSIHSIDYGEIFTFQDEYFILTANPNGYVGIHLETGEWRVFNYDDVVLPVNATLTIE